MRRPKVEQLQLIRVLIGNGWGDGDFVEDQPRGEQQKYRRAIISFEKWLEHLQGAQFQYHLIGGK
jgi:hypothetical protein